MKNKFIVWAKEQFGKVIKAADVDVDGENITLYEDEGKAFFVPTVDGFEFVGFKEW